METTIRDKSISMTERTDSVSTILKTPMTLIEFKERYNELLNYHLNEYDDNNELSFVKNWIIRYSNGCNLLAKRTDPNLTPTEKRGLKALGTKELYGNLELSFSLICKFLEQRKKEVKKELKTNPEPPQQPKAVNPDEVKNPPQHPNIFKGNAFEVWQRMFNEFQIINSSRTDIDFMFEIMKYDGLIYANIGLTDILNWINKTYELAVEKVKYTDPKSKSNKKRMSTYNLINPK